MYKINHITFQTITLTSTSVRGIYSV